MKFYLTTLGGEIWHEQCLHEWNASARADTVGRHSVTIEPERADRLVFVDLHQHPDDPFLRQLRRHPLVRKFREKVYVFDQRDRPVRTLSGVYVSAASRHRLERGVVGGPYPYLHNSASPPAVEPSLLWSFCGSRTHRVRDVILKLNAPNTEVRDTTGVPMFTADVGEAAATRHARKEYTALLARSKYVLCPRGHGPSTFRMFETLAAGRVPVVVSDAWLPPPRVDWAECILRVAEGDAARIPDLLQAQTDEDWQRMSRAAHDVWRRNFAPDRVWDYLAESLARLPPSRERSLWWFRRDALRLGAARTRAVLRRGG